MSLVAYGNSDSEEEIEDQDEVVSSSTASSTLQAARIDNEENTDEPVSSSTVSAPKKQRETVKITIPSLEQFKDEDTDPEPRKKPTFKSGSGLFSILPPPKYSGAAITHNFKPHVLTKKKETKTNPAPRTETVNQVTTSVSYSKFDPDSTINSADTESHEDADSPPKFDFFSLDSSSVTAETEGQDLQHHSQSALFSSLPDPVQSSSSYVPPENNFLPSALPYEEPVQEVTGSYYSHVNETNDDQSFLNDEEFLKMKGKRGREEINIIDVNGADQLTGKDEWLMQSLTEEKVERPSKRRHGMPTQQQKRKHQITYLAFQAKERELDLKNQWAMNSLTRRETQAKYGF